MTTLAEAQARLGEYMQAESDLLAGGQEVRVTTPNGIDRSMTMADLREIRRGIAHWRGQVAYLQAKANGQATFAGMTYSSADFGNSSGRG